MKPIRLGGAAGVAAVLSLVLVACGSTSAAGGNDAPATGDVAITAADMAFAPGTVTVDSAGASFTIAFENTDAMPHNIAIRADESKSEKLFEGELVTDGSVVYTVPALDAGEYVFDCSLHPNMTGTLVVEG
jgi:plastocyanin